jgi:phytoene dehydrogenase-like protein
MVSPLDQNLRDIQQLRQEISSVRRRAQRRASKYLDQGTTAYQTVKRLFTDFPVGSLIVTMGLAAAALATAKSWWQPLREQTESTWRNWDWQQIYSRLINTLFKQPSTDETANSETTDSSDETAWNSVAEEGGDE